MIIKKNIKNNNAVLWLKKNSFEVIVEINFPVEKMTGILLPGSDFCTQ